MVVVAPLLLHVVVAAVNDLVVRAGSGAAQVGPELRRAEITIFVALGIDPGVALGIGDRLAVLVAERGDRRICGTAVGPGIPGLAGAGDGVVGYHGVEQSRLGGRVIAAVAGGGATQRAAGRRRVDAAAKATGRQQEIDVTGSLLEVVASDQPCDLVLQLLIGQAHAPAWSGPWLRAAAGRQPVIVDHRAGVA